MFIFMPHLGYQRYYLCLDTTGTNAGGGDTISFDAGRYQVKITEINR
jgi:hypothetical protein